MEKVAGTGRKAGCRGPMRRGAVAAASLAVFAGCPAASAQDAPPQPADLVLAQARTEQAPVRVEVQASTVPRLDAQDSGFQAPRVDLSFLPGKRGGAGLGPVLGVTGFSTQQPQLAGLAPMRPSVDLGLRFSHRLENQHRIDITAWRRMSAPDDAYSLLQMRQEPVYGARVEMNIKPAKLSILGFDRGFIGFQLESGARISIKRKDGRPMIYYRTAF